MKLFKTSALTGALIALTAVPASAHAGPHEAPFFATVIHWLTSPSHALIAVVGSVALIALAVKIKRSRS